MGGKRHTPHICAVNIILGELAARCQRSRGQARGAREARSPREAARSPREDGKESKGGMQQFFKLVVGQFRELWAALLR